MAEIKLRRKIIYSGEVFASFMAKGWNCTELANVLRACKEVDAVEVVRCKDCKWSTSYGDLEDKWTRCTNLHGNPAMPDDGFCSYGERKEENK